MSLLVELLACSPSRRTVVRMATSPNSVPIRRSTIRVDGLNALVQELRAQLRDAGPPDTRHALVEAFEAVATGSPAGD